MKRVLAGLSLVVLLPPTAPGQSASARFETADVRPSAAGAREGGGFLPEGRFECRGTTLRKLIAAAHNVNADFIAGGPDWLDLDRFDITAKAASPRTSQQGVRGMLQVLLADSFGLAVHEEKRNMPVYLLEAGKKGPKLQGAATASAPACPAVDGPPGLNHRECRAFAMADLSRLLPQIAGNYVDRPVVDMTGFLGRYDFSLDWMGKTAYLAAKANADGAPAVSIFDAIAKLGLRLEPGTRPAPVIVIDHVDRLPVKDPPSAIPTEFEVAEIRPSKPGTTGSLTAQNGRLEIFGFTLRRLIAIALGSPDDMVTGGPKWLDLDRFDVIAKSPDVASPHATGRMLKALIVPRFKLEMHSEEQPVPVFALVLGKHSPKLKETTGSSHSECKWNVQENGVVCLCRNTTMAQLAQRLPEMAGAYLTHPAVDLTDLQGAYDFSLVWTPRAQLPDSAGGVQAAAPGVDLTIFEAIDKQLGLRLEERKHPMPVIVIDHVERTPDGDE